MNINRTKVINGINRHIEHSELIRALVAVIPIGILVRLRICYMIPLSEVPVGRSIIKEKKSRGWVRLLGDCVVVVESFNYSSVVCSIVCSEFGYPIIRLKSQKGKDIKTAISFNHIHGWSEMEVKDLVLYMGYEYRMPLFSKYLSGVLELRTL